jgi:preprotein translocase subunit SecD
VPVEWILTLARIPPDSTVAGMIALALVVAFALVTGRILKLATDSSMFMGVTLALTYFLVINLLLSMAAGRGA